MHDAPRFRIWPPVALGVPLLGGLVITATAGDPFPVPSAARLLGWVLLGGFMVWNGWTLSVMVANRTAVLPGGATRTILDRGPFRVSRNPLYLGLIAFDATIALLWPSIWGLLLVPLGVLALTWGAIVPEEQYLLDKFGPDYDAYRRRVRRWL